uniref:C2H2-type domain-containing protein n=1 Tax=Peronospora matthiolae TaxID=2874970 RepID=A0AAV1V936_9STRA
MPCGDELYVTACLEHDDDENKRSEDACSQGSSQDVPMPAAGQQGPGLSVYAHNAPKFKCTLCAYTACDLAALARHRRTAHRGTCFVDHFHSGCMCGIGHRSRAAATKHALTCLASPSYTSAAARDSRKPASTSPPLHARSVWHALHPEENPTPHGPSARQLLRPQQLHQAALCPQTFHTHRAPCLPLSLPPGITMSPHVVPISVPA